ncbi:TonB-dependent receptor [Steroidobacter sp.]|uniref:TonB-dependent receptor n=1 Tax=Steroidobacter sp. TaxID=1978227 RepID=UPI001A41C580|nr:TonB-dependent receptor [Steroidobacter sp.]MBL8266681.1 TonB-dependent receptor [Steroidobacter sp.]
MANTFIRKMAGVGCLLPVLASAQEATQQMNQQAAPVEEVVVSGIRYSIANSVDVKIESNSIVESISAEDIGKLPDVSIADSISRLPGLATQRVDGRSQVINVRGMSEQFVGTLLNGREQVSTGDSRGVEFDQYPAELINAVTVYKTYDAGLIGQGLSGTVNLQTIKPLSLGKQRIVFSGTGEYNSLGDVSADGDSKGYRASASYVDQFANDTIGVAIGIARLNSPFQEEHYKQWWWANTDLWGTPQAGKPTDAIALQGSEAWVKSRDLTRDGIIGVLEFKPNENFHSELDAYYSKFTQDEVMHGAMWTNDPFWNSNQVSYTNARTTGFNGQQVVTGGTLNGVQPVVRNDDNQRDDKLYSAGWANTFTFDAWAVDLDLSYSKAERDQSQLETYAGLLGPQSIGFDIPVNSRFGRYTLPNLADAGTVYLWDPQGWNHDGRIENSEQEDEIKAARLNLGRSFDNAVISGFDVGANFNRRTKDKRATVYFADLLNDRTPVTLNGSALRSPTSLGFAGISNVITFNPRRVINSGLYDIYVSESNDDLRKDYTVDEDVDTYYARLNLNIAASDRIKLRGNVGVQYIRTDQSSTGFNASGGAIAGSQTLGATYNDTLPSLNLVADFGDGWMARFGIAKSLMRPPINYLSADADASVNEFGQWTGSGGNPKLEPYRANSIDLSLEKYLADASYVAVAIFYKDIKTYLYRENLAWDFSSYDNSSDIDPISPIGVFSTWKNGTGGYMRGIEGTTTLTGDLFTPALEGFGIQLNASYTESSIDPDGPEGSSTDTIPGLSKVVVNGTLFYERNGFAARLSERYRDTYRGEYSSLFGQRTYRYTLSERQLDLQLSYDFQEGSRAQGLSLLFQVYNLNNEPFRTTVSDANGLFLTLPEEYTEYGRQYLLGFRYSLQ